DRRRIFATGMSNGGFFASLLGCELAARLAAVAPVAGALPLDGCVPARPVPVLLVHGRADRVVAPATARAARDWLACAGCCGTRGPASPVDSIGELWFDRIDDYRDRLYDSPDGERAILDDVGRFLAGADAYLTVEHVQRAAAAPSPTGRTPGDKLFACLQRTP